MKKILPVFLCLLIVVSLVACGKTEDKIDKNYSETTSKTNDVNQDESTKPNNTNTEASKYDYDDGVLVPAEYRFDVDSDEYNQIKSLQGKFQHIENGGTDITFVADNTWYMPSYGNFEKISKVPEQSKQFKYFNNVSVGKNLICFTDTVLNIINDEGGYRCNDIYFDVTKDMFVPSDDFDPTCPYVITKNGDWYDVCKWITEHNEDGCEKQNTDGTYNYTMEYDQKPIGKITVKSTLDENYDVIDGKDITNNIADIFPIADHHNGFEVVILTKDGDVYFVGEISRGETKYDKTIKESVLLNYEVETSTSAPIVSGAKKIFTHDLILTQPIYIKNNDESALYSAGAGESVTDKSDDIIVKFIMPDGHKASEVVNVFSCYTNAIFVFENGDVYYTDQLSDKMFMLDAAGEYTMKKHDILTEAMKNGDVKTMRSAQSMIYDQCVYVLKNDGTLWACDISDCLR